ncbi:L-ascorbate oxidase-like [Branchiostoma floridae]|uniref:ferroxidase n=1 Tax=Branchiostoma floridae TaxID=7739 RepID=A0A9J7HTW5_BRAFL|nr:L-ascorbate oxidase-like [Branchiostoma floridae]
MSIKILVILSVLCTTVVTQETFVNSVPVPYPPRQDLYVFNWTVEHWETMFLYNKQREAGTPVIIDSLTGVYSKREYNSSSQSCELTAMSEDEISQVTTADGYHRRTTLVNKQLPGPTIVVWKGAQVAVTVTNKLIQEGVAIHWHGITQHNTPWMDGVGSVSQCPISPGESFTYRFTASEGGTHWWHAHLGTFRTDGLYGALIVLENDTSSRPPLPVFHQEFVMLLHDWQREDSLDTYLRVEWEATRFSHGYGDTNTCRKRLTQADGTDLGPVHFTSGLINGKGRSYDDNDNAENRFVPLEKFSVEGNMTYRFRVISAAMMFPFRVSVDQHELTLIATDGDRIVEQTAESFIINTGERYDFYITTDQTPGNYWIRADTIELYADNMPVNRQHHTEAILHYEGAPDAEPTSQRRTCTANDTCVVVNCPFRQYGDQSMHIECLPVSELRSPDNQFVPLPESADKWEEHFINFHFAGSDINPGQRSSVNGHRFVLPSSPPQVTGDRGLVPCTDELCGGEKYCDCSYHVTITPGNVVQMVLYNMGSGAGLAGTGHPVHIHGHHFYVLDMGFPEYNSSDGRYSSQNPDIDCGTSERCNGKRWADQSWEGGNKPGLNLRDPPMKDTVIVPVGGYVVIRFTADNPGWWFVHCHIEIHQVEGMAMMIREGTQGQMNPPPPGFPTCGEFHWSSAEFERAKKGYSTSWTHTLSVAAGGGIGAAVGFIVGLGVGIICYECSKKSATSK